MPGKNKNEIVGQGWAFPPHVDAQGSLALTNRYNELEQALRIILATAPGQRVMRPDFGCRLHELLFAPNNSQAAARAHRYVEEAIGRWEPRVRLLDLAVRPDPEDGARLLVEVEYEVKRTQDRRSLVYPFYLIPEE